MPTPNRLQIDPPKNWEDFEELCCDLWRELWGDPHTRMHGRRGQPQHGVDIYGQPGGGPEWAGVQCKGKNRGLSKQLTEKEIKDEVCKTDDFNVRLSSFVIATTASRDVKLQKVAREITARGGMRVTISFWEDIQQDLTKFPDLLAKHYPHLADSETRREASLRRDYLNALWSQLLPVPLLALGGVGRRDDVPLSAVYTALDVTAVARVGKEEGLGEAVGRVAGEAGALGLRGDRDYLELARARITREAEAHRKKTKSESYQRRWTALEAAAASSRLVLLGPAGSGKSTFARHLALSLAGDLLGKSEASLDRLNALADPLDVSDAEHLPWPHGALVPIFVELRRLVGSEAFPGEKEEGEAGHLLAYLEDEAVGPEAPRFGPVIRDALGDDGAGCLLILDGLDETPEAERCREPLRQVIGSWTRRFPRCRVLVTSRPYAYDPKSPWRLDGAGFEEATLAPFDEEKIGRYVEGWYGLLAQRGQVSAEQAERWSRDLRRQISATRHLQPLAERPLMLGMMADLHAESGGRFRGGRADLYERSVELLLDRWNEIRDVGEGRSVAELLGMELDEIRRALQRLAYQTHRERGGGSEGKGSEITDAELWKVLDQERSRERLVDERRVMDYLHQRSGIVVADSPTQYRFPHRSFQEYLAACHLLEHDFPEQLESELESSPERWREVTLLAANREASRPLMVWSLLESLVGEEPPSELDAGDPRFVRALYAGLAVEESQLAERIQPKYQPKLERIPRWLERTVEVGALSPVDRASAGRVLGLLGDRRSGVGLGSDGVPEIAWAEVPEGSFLMGSGRDDEIAYDDEKPQRQIELPAFQISGYPVTNAQYRAFVEDGGYTEQWRECWTEAGWKWKGERSGPNDELPPEFLLGNHPRVNVSWYEAVAFCGWLGERLGIGVRLPTESEWEKASRGPDGRSYPWGDQFDASRCNALETEIGRTSAVGCFPSGASPYGALDMSGNVEEWCSTKWRKSYEEPADENIRENASRVLRGGSFVNAQWYVRCAVRLPNVPFHAFRSAGFRVAAPI